MRTSTQQALKMVEFMEQNGDISKPNPDDGELGRHKLILKWVELTKILNEDPTGESKSTAKWRKVWSDYKNNTKKKLTKINGIPNSKNPAERIPSKKTLSELEIRVLQIMNIKAVQNVTADSLDWQADASSNSNSCHSSASNDSDEEDACGPPTNNGDGDPFILLVKEEADCNPNTNQPIIKNRIQREISTDSFVPPRVYASKHERVRVECIENKRLKQKDEELRLKELEIMERSRLRDLELQQQSQWLEFMRECKNDLLKYFSGRR